MSDINTKILENLDIIDEYPIFEIEYNKDGTKKKFYSLASEKDIKETQIKSDENELQFKYNENKITKEEYDREMSLLKAKLEGQNTVYDNLIFDLIRDEEMDELKEEIKEAKLDRIELERLATSLESIAEKKINDFQENNKEFKQTDINTWSYKYDTIAKNYAKTRELEGYILSIIE